MLIRGLDVSAYQPSINWKAVAASGYRFVYLRCGIGNGAPDATFANRKSEAMSAGLVVGAYHFAYPLPEDAAHPGRNPVEQARAHHAACNGLGSQAGELLPALDLEWPPPDQWAHWGVTAASIVAWAVAYLAEAEALYGLRPLLYIYPDFVAHLVAGANLDPLAKYPLWFASYRGAPPNDNTPMPACLPWGTAAVWQHTNKLVVAGIDVDGDVLDGASMASLARGSAIDLVTDPPNDTVPPPPDEVA